VKVITCKYGSIVVSVEKVSNAYDLFITDPRFGRQLVEDHIFPEERANQKANEFAGLCDRGYEQGYYIQNGEILNRNGEGPSFSEAIDYPRIRFV